MNASSVRVRNESQHARGEPFITCLNYDNRRDHMFGVVVEKTMHRICSGFGERQAVALARKEDAGIRKHRTIECRVSRRRSRWNDRRNWLTISPDRNGVWFVIREIGPRQRRADRDRLGLVGERGRR